MKKYDKMIDICGTNYYVDMDALDKAILSKSGKPTDKIVFTEEKKVFDGDGESLGTEETTTTSVRGKEIDIHKYEIIREMLMSVLDENEETDETLGMARAFEDKSMGFKICFNTLLKYDILAEEE